jgi:hypothetical protein
MEILSEPGDGDECICGLASSSPWPEGPRRPALGRTPDPSSKAPNWKLIQPNSLGRAALIRRKYPLPCFYPGYGVGRICPRLAAH